jgi:UDP-glucuronate 4-epimerase
VRGTAVILEEAARIGAHVMFASSSSVYGERGDGEPFRETDDTVTPVSPYAATKRSCELLAHGFFAARRLSVVCARIFTAFGPRQRPDLAVRKFAERMLRGEPVTVYGDGSALRDFTFVDDLVSGLVAGIDAPPGFSIYNFGAGRTISVRRVLEVLEDVLGVKAKIDWQPPQAGDVSRTWADIGAAQRALGYAPRVSFEEGVRRFASWLEQAR